MERNEHPAGALDLVGGRTCLDFVNTVGSRSLAAASERGTGGYRIRDEKLDSYESLVAWSQHAALLKPADAEALLRKSRRQQAEAHAVLARAMALREGTYRVFKAIVDGIPPRSSDLDVLNREVAIASARAKLVPREGRFVWEWTDTRNALDRMLWATADSAAEFLTGGDLSRLRECGGEDCGWLFEDTSKNRSRQWCDMRTCGNLAKVHRFRSRLRLGHASQDGSK